MYMYIHTCPPKSKVYVPFFKGKHHNYGNLVHIHLKQAITTSYYMYVLLTVPLNFYRVHTINLVRVEVVQWSTFLTNMWCTQKYKARACIQVKADREKYWVAGNSCMNIGFLVKCLTNWTTTQIAGLTMHAMWYNQPDKGGNLHVHVIEL